MHAAASLPETSKSNISRLGYSIASLCLLVLLFLLPTFGLNRFWISYLDLTFIYIILAISVHIIVGLAGIFSFGHVVGWGVGAYTSAILTTKLGLAFPGGAIIAIAVGALIGLVVGISCMRLNGIYLAIITVGWSLVLSNVATNWVSLTGGGMGILPVPPIKFGALVISSDAGFFYFGLAVVAIAILAARNLEHSRTGRALIAIRESPIAAGAMGVNVAGYKLLAFVLSGVFASLAGLLFAHRSGHVFPGMFSLSEGVLIFIMVIIGGMGSLAGAIIGVTILTLLPEVFHPLASVRLTVYGIVLIAIIMFAPGGIAVVLRRAGHLVYERARVFASKFQDRASAGRSRG